MLVVCTGADCGVCCLSLFCLVYVVVFGFTFNCGCLFLRLIVLLLVCVTGLWLLIMLVRCDSLLWVDLCYGVLFALPYCCGLLLCVGWFVASLVC